MDGLMPIPTRGVAKMNTPPFFDFSEPAKRTCTGWNCACEAPYGFGDDRNQICKSYEPHKTKTLSRLSQMTLSQRLQLKIQTALTQRRFYRDRLLSLESDIALSLNRAFGH